MIAVTFPSHSAIYRKQLSHSRPGRLADFSPRGPTRPGVVKFGMLHLGPTRSRNLFCRFLFGWQANNVGGVGGTIRVWDVELLEERGEMDGWQMERDLFLQGYWILGPVGEDLFWSRPPFRHARDTLVIGKCLKIDFSNVVYGEREKCREPL